MEQLLNVHPFLRVRRSGENSGDGDGALTPDNEPELSENGLELSNDNSSNAVTSETGVVAEDNSVAKKVGGAVLDKLHELPRKLGLFMLPLAVELYAKNICPVS